MNRKRLVTDLLREIGGRLAQDLLLLPQLRDLTPCFLVLYGSNDHHYRDR